MRRKKHLDRGGGGGTELFICFTSRPSSAGHRTSSSSKVFSPGGGGGGIGGETVPAPLFQRSHSRRLRNSGSLKGGQSPMFPAGTGSSGGGGPRRGRGGLEPAEPSSPKVTCIGQVRVKGGKRKPKHAAALRSRSRGGGGLGGGSEASFRRGGDDRDGLSGKNQGWVYQIPVNICEALKTFGSCGGRSLCSPARERGVRSAGDKKRRRTPAGGSWLCGAVVARCLLAIQEEDDEVGNGAAVGPADEVKESELGLVIQGWDVDDDDEEETGVVVGEVDVEKEDEILVVGKEDEGRVSVCIPPRNALLLMRCRSDPVRMAALSTRFWGSPAAASVGQVDNEGDNCNEDEGKEEEDAVVSKECNEKARHSAVSIKEVLCQECVDVEDGGGEAADVGQLEMKDTVKEEKDGDCRGDEVGKDEPIVAPIVRKDACLEVALAGEATKRESETPGMVEVVPDSKEDGDVPRPEEEGGDVKGRRSTSSCSQSTTLKEDRKLRRSSSRRRAGSSSSSRASSGSNRVDRRHSFSAEMDARRSSFSTLKDSRRASFSIDRDGRRWSFTIDQEHLVAEPKVLMASKKVKIDSSCPELEKDCSVLVAPNSAEEAQESQDDGKEEATKDADEEETTIQGADIDKKVEQVETRADKEKIVTRQERRKKSGELPDCLLMMMYEPKLSMEVSRETWVCSTDFIHWKSYQGQNHRNNHTAQKAAIGSDTAASEETKVINNAQGTNIRKDTEESRLPALVNSVPMPPRAVQKPSLKPAVEQTLKVELPMVAGAAAYAPFVLKRCKSEPLRSSTRLAPDACFWKDRHRPLNATGVGF